MTTSATPIPRIIGIKDPLGVGKVSTIVWPLLTTLMLGLAEFEPLLMLTTYDPSGTVKVTVPCESVTPCKPRDAIVTFAP